MGRKYKRMKLMKAKERLAARNAVRIPETVLKAIEDTSPIPEVTLAPKIVSEPKLEAVEAPAPKPRTRRKRATTKKKATPSLAAEEKPKKTRRRRTTKKVREKTNDQ